MVDRLLSVLISVIIAVASFFSGLEGLFGRSDVVVLYTNDVHCNVSENEKIGYSELAAYKKSIEQSSKNVTLVDCGDFIQGGTVGAISSGEYIIDIMNQVGYDMAVLGNHEFDYGMEQLNKLIRQSDFDYLGCNVTYSGKGENQLSDLQDYEIVDYGNVQVGFIGVSTPSSQMTSTPAYFKDESGNFVYGFEADLCKTVQRYVAEARLHGADYIVVLSHLGDTREFEPYTSQTLISGTYGIDVVLDGHAHHTIEMDFVNNCKGEKVILSSTGTRFDNFGQLTISSDGDISTRLISDYDETDPETTQCIEKINESYEKKLSEVVGSTDFKLSISDENGIRLVRNRETGIGNMCADAYRMVTGADIALCNGGGIRKDISAGEITNGEILDVHPFGNLLGVIEATGQQIADALEWTARLTQKEYVIDGKSIGENGGFLQVSGLQYTIDTTVVSAVTQDGNGAFSGVTGERRVKNIMVLSGDTYVPIEMNKTYIVAGTEYVLVNNGDGMTAFNTSKIVSSNGMLDYEALILYITRFMNGKIDSRYASTEGRIVIE